jgi:hypothetical protein
MKGTLTSVAWVLVPICLVAGTLRMRQAPRHSIVLSRVNFEVGMTYEPLGKVTLGCAAKDFSQTIDWDDDTPIEMLSDNARPEPGLLIQPGTYVVFSTHRYASTGTYTVTSNLSVQCAGANRLEGAEDKFVAHVFGQVPLSSFTAPRSVRRGDLMELRLTLAAPAPPSQTRIFLKNDSPDAFLQHSFPQFVNVPANLDHVVFKLRTRTQTKSDRVTLTAVAVNGMQTVAIDLK